MSKPSLTPAVSRREFLKTVGLATASTSLYHLLQQEPPPAQATLDSPFEPAAISALPPLAVIALNRLAFGPRPGDISAFNALGATDEERLTAYVDQQLNPNHADDPEVSARFVESNITTFTKTMTQLWQEHFRDPEGLGINHQLLPYREVERAAFVRTMYSQWQLFEVLADFWHNHFNVFAPDFPLRSFFVQFDRDVIRAHQLGNFREMLEAVATSPVMLYYLDNESNTVAGPNENWARELFELHTLGAENYLGVMKQIDVPVDNEGNKIGYVDEDVYEATRCFTGWSTDSTAATGDTGEFLYKADNHDRFQKFVLGQQIVHDQPALKDGRDVLDLLAYHPGTARYICRKLCIRFINDNPPESLVQAAADLFRAQKNAPDQLKQVVRFIILSPEFRTTWGKKIKRPLEVVVSSLRALNVDFTIKWGDAKSDGFINMYNTIGQPLFQWPPPNGYPDVALPWQNSTSMLMRWRMMSWMAEYTDVDTNLYWQVLEQTPADVRTANELADFWIDRILGRPMEPAHRQILVDFMAQTTDPDTDLDLANAPTYGRLRSMIALILQYPDFNWR
jgi:uncharacterized protein (DUF1800 family)